VSIDKTIIYNHEQHIEKSMDDECRRLKSALPSMDPREDSLMKQLNSAKILIRVFLMATQTKRARIGYPAG
jgi:hypothetical protein